MHIVKHFLTITRHRHMVMHNCFKCGLIKQGLLHDLSKLSFVEFFNGAKYYIGTKSPHHNERADKGYSDAWMHHKGRNKHHPEYWFDYNPKLKCYASVRMPKKYVAEMICDRIAASKNYNRGHFTNDIPYNYFLHGENSLMHEDTKKECAFLLKMYMDDGEKKTFKYIKKVYLKQK